MWPYLPPGTLLLALCASSPILDGKFTGALDARLKYYKTNQAKIPSITGRVIPEAVFSKRNYFKTIYDKIKNDIAQYDTENILNPIWVNSRGAIPRFDRGSIEIRIMDIQECAAADLAIVTCVIETIKALVEEKFIDHERQMKWRTEDLAKILDATTEKAQDATIENGEYLQVFGFTGKSVSAAELWKHIFETLHADGNQSLAKWKPQLSVILNNGTLAKRILEVTGQQPSHEQIRAAYRKMCDCLAGNTIFFG